MGNGIRGLWLLCAVGFAASLLLEKAVATQVALTEGPPPLTPIATTCAAFELPMFRDPREKPEPPLLLEGCSTFPNTWGAVDDGRVVAAMFSADMPFERWASQVRNLSRLVVLPRSMSDAFATRWTQWQDGEMTGPPPSLPAMVVQRTGVRTKGMEIFEVVDADAPRASDVSPGLWALLVGALVVMSLSLFFARRLRRRPPHTIPARALTTNFLCDISSVAARIETLDFARVFGALLIGGWLLEAVDVGSGVWAPQLAVSLGCAFAVFVDIPRGGPLIVAAALLSAANCIVVLWAWNTGTLPVKADVAKTVGFAVMESIVLGWGVSSAWRLARVKVLELATAPLSLGPAFTVRPGRFASRRYLAVSAWSTLIGMFVFVRYPLTLVVFDWLAIGWALKPSRILHRLQERRAAASAVLAAHWQPRDQRPAALLIRSFADDTVARRFASKAPASEDGLIDALWAYAPVVTFGDPRGADATPGALRVFMRDSQSEDDGWRREFERRATAAVLVVAFIGSTKSFAWELSTLASLGMVHKLVLLVPPFDGLTIEERWEAMQANLASIPGAPYAGLAAIECPRLIAAFPVGDHWVAVQAKERSRAAYQAALRMVAQLKRMAA